ncbi:hypothetical protein [Streptomyces sp. NBC_01455]|uniref:hypothetical protein n=1 Tax=Streptomyces sp. NBC_01455 TaxID=2903874 RepID=UPI002E32F5CC|nr:hypothetical protein [Streptomyces sp. NBC_01455]
MRGRLPRPRDKGGAAIGPAPVDRRKTGSEHHPICDGKGTPLRAVTIAANVNDITQALASPRASRPPPHVVEQTFALLHQFTRLAVRRERRLELRDAFLSLACSLICRRRLKEEPLMGRWGGRRMQGE